MKHVGERTEGDYDILQKAKEVAGYVLRITQNEKFFPKRYRFSVTNKMQEKAMDIVEKLVEAYEIYPNSQKEFDERISRMKVARAEIRSLLTLTEVAAETFGIRASAFEHLTRLLVDLKTHLTAWIRSDLKRFKDKGHEL